MAGLEEILARLLVPDNAVIQQATRDLQAVYKDPSIIPVLCDILLGSGNPQIRQFSAVLLRKRLVKLWKTLAPEAQQRVKATLLQCLVQEQVHLVLVSTAHLVSVIARHEFSKGQWDELSQFIMQHCQSPEPMRREVGLLLLSSLMESATVQLQPQFPQLLQLFSSALEDNGNQMVPFYALKSLTAMVEYVGDDETPIFQSMIPKIMAVVRTLIVQDEDKACDAMELFDELVECEVGIVVPHLGPLIHFCLEVASNANLGNNIRVKALSFVSWLATLKKKALLKHGLLPAILKTVLTIMATPAEDDDLPDDSVQSQSPITLASQVLDILALHLPPDKIFTPVLRHIEPWFQSPNQFERCAALIAVAVMTEGCSEHIRNNHLPALLQVVYKGEQIVCKGINDEQRVVRNAALFAVGQFSEHLQPDISQYSGDLLPALFQFADFAIRSPQQESSGLTKIFYALETFCEQLGTDLLPYLPTLMDKLFLALTVTDNVHIQELAISAIGATANACQDKLLPYFPKIIEVLKGYISMPYNQDLSVLQAQAVDTLGILARTIGEKHFQPLAQECILLGMVQVPPAPVLLATYLTKLFFAQFKGQNLMQTTDPDLRRSVYGMFASVSCVLKEAMATHLDSIIKRMIESLQSDEGVTVHYTSSEVPFLDFDDGDEEDQGMAESLEDDEGIEGFSVENAYLEEKEDTCNALGEIAENVGAQFLPYIDDCFREVNLLSEHSSEGIRKASITTLGRFCKVWYQCLSGSAEDDRTDLEILINSTLVSLAATARTDSDRTVVAATLESLEDLFRSLKSTAFPLTEKALESLMVSIQDILECKAQCQEESDDDDGAVGSDEMAEYDSMVLECAGSVIAPIASVVGGEVFLPWLGPLLPSIIGRLKPRTSTVAERSFAVGTLAEVVEAVGNHARFLLQLYPLFVNSLGDGEDEVCSNAVFGLGVLAANALPDIQTKYPDILRSLFTVAQSRRNSRIVDNVIGAVCRMITANQSAVPLDQVLPVVIQNLPLKEDLEENKTVYGCIVRLFEASNPIMMSHLQPMLKVIAHELSPSSHLTEDLQLQLVRLVQALNTQCPEQVQAASMGLSQEQLALLTRALHGQIQQTTA